MTREAMVVDVSQDWVTACDVQQRFMQGPDQTIETLDYGAHCRQLQALGGDCYDFVRLADQRLALTIGDASGKGLAAALMMAHVQSSLRTATLFTGNDLAAAVQVVNRQVYASSLINRYAALFYGVFEGASRMLRYVNAGHNPPMVILRDGSTQFLGEGGAPVGMFQHATYQEGAIQLEPGDLVIAYTDGMTEARNPAGEEWGVEGLRTAAIECSEERAEQIVRAIFASMDKFTKDFQADDATVAILHVR